MLRKFSSFKTSHSENDCYMYLSPTLPLLQNLHFTLFNASSSLIVKTFFEIQIVLNLNCDN